MSDEPQRPPVRFLHTSDVHLGSHDRGDVTDEKREWKHTGFRRVIDIGRREQVDFMVIAGDFFDHARVMDETLRFAAEEIARLERPVILLPGNHDHVGQGSVYDRLDLTAIAPNLHIMRGREGVFVSIEHLGVELWGRSHAEDGTDLLPFADAPKRNGAAWHIGVGHGHYLHPDSGFHPSYHIREEELMVLDYDYVALGHWDRQLRVAAGDVTAAYSGAPDGLAGRYERVLIVTLDEQTGTLLTSHSVAGDEPIAHDDIPLLRGGWPGWTEQTG